MRAVYDDSRFAEHGGQNIIWSFVIPWTKYRGQTSYGAASSLRRLFAWLNPKFDGAWIESFIHGVERIRLSDVLAVDLTKWTDWGGPRLNKRLVSLHQSSKVDSHHCWSSQVPGAVQM